VTTPQFTRGLLEKRDGGDASGEPPIFTGGKDAAAATPTATIASSRVAAGIQRFGGTLTLACPFGQGFLWQPPRHGPRLTSFWWTVVVSNSFGHTFFRLQARTHEQSSAHTLEEEEEEEEEEQVQAGGGGGGEPGRGRQEGSEKGVRSIINPMTGFASRRRCLRSDEIETQEAEEDQMVMEGVLSKDLKR